MNIKTVFFSILFFCFSNFYSQNKKQIIFKDTIVFIFNPNDFVYLESTYDDFIFYRKEEINNKNLTNYFQIKPTEKLDSEYSTIGLNDFLQSKKNFNNENNSFKYSSIERKFNNSEIIFIDTTCIENKYYSAKIIRIID